MAGNVRQLKNVIERLVILSGFRDPRSGVSARPFPDEALPEARRHSATLDELNTLKKELLETTFSHIQKAFVLKALRASKGNISHAAASVGMQRPNFHALMRKYKISAPTSRRMPKISVQIGNLKNP